MIKNLLADTEFEPISTDNSDLNRIQNSLQAVYEYMGENMQKNIGIVTIPPAPSLEGITSSQIMDKAIYVEEAAPVDEALSFDEAIAQAEPSPYCHYSKAYFEKPVFVGVGRGITDGQVEISTLFHESPNLYLGRVLSLDGEPNHRVIGLSQGLGVLR